MNYTDKQIEDMASEMFHSGANEVAVNDFIRTARQEQRRNDRPASDTPFASQQAVQKNAVATAKDIGSKTLGLAADVGIEATMAGAGQALGGMTGPFAPVGVPLGGFIGGTAGNIIGQKRRGEDIKWGQALGAGLVDAVPGANLAKAGAGTLAKEAYKYAATNMVGKNIETLVDEKRPSTLTEQGLAGGMGLLSAKMGKLAATGNKSASIVQSKVDDLIKNENISDMLKVGYVVDPAISNRDSTMNKLVNRVAGASQVQRAAVHANQPITDRLAKEAINFPVGEDFGQTGNFVLAGKTVEEPVGVGWKLEEHMRKLAEPYREVEKISPMTKRIVEKISDLRGEASAKYLQFKNFANPEAGTPKLRKAAEALSNQADKLENSLEKIVAAAGNPGLYQDYVAARELVAKAHVVKNALMADGHVSAPTIGAMWDAEKRKLTGQLELIARAQRTMPQVMSESAVTQVPGQQSFRPFLAAAAGGYGYQHGGPIGMAAGAGAVALGNIPARALAVNPAYQRFMAIPRYSENQPDMAANIMRFATQSAGRK